MSGVFTGPLWNGAGSAGQPGTPFPAAPGNRDDLDPARVNRSAPTGSGVLVRLRPGHRSTR